MAIGPRAPFRERWSVVDQALHRRGEGVTPVGVAGEHVHGGTARGQEDRVTRVSEVRRGHDRTLHGGMSVASVVAVERDDRNIWRVSRKCGGDDVAVAAQ